jgi:hypothetical protein
MENKFELNTVSGKLYQHDWLVYSKFNTALKMNIEKYIIRFKIRNPGYDFLDSRYLYYYFLQ